MRTELLVLLMCFLLIIQTTWLQVPAFSWIQVNTCLVLLLFIAFFRGPISGLLFGVMIGLILDVTTGTFVGGQMFAYGVAGYFAGSFFKMFLNKYMLLFTVTLMVFSVIQVFLEYGIHSLFTSRSFFVTISTFDFAQILSISLRSMIFNGFVSLFAYPLARKWLPVKKRRTLVEEGV